MYKNGVYFWRWMSNASEYLLLHAEPINEKMDAVLALSKGAWVSAHLGYTSNDWYYVQDMLLKADLVSLLNATSILAKLLAIKQEKGSDISTDFIVSSTYTLCSRRGSWGFPEKNKLSTLCSLFPRQDLEQLFVPAKPALVTIEKTIQCLETQKIEPFYDVGKLEAYMGKQGFQSDKLTDFHAKQTKG